jgi:hypothetical protein
MVPGRGRPEPPKPLDMIEARAWNDVIDALPGRWLDASAQLILRRVVAQVAIAERTEARLRELAGQDDTPEILQAEAVLGAMHRETARSSAQGDAQKPHGPTGRAQQVRAPGDLVPAMGDRGEEERWPRLVSPHRRPARSPRPM